MMNALKEEDEAVMSGPLKLDLCFLSPHRSLPGNFINFDYKYFRFDRIWQITATKKLK